MNSGFWMTVWFIGGARAALRSALGLLQSGSAPFVGTQRTARDAAARSTLCVRPTDILGGIPEFHPDLARIFEPAASKDPDQSFPGGEKFAAKLRAAFAGSFGEAAISVGGVDISL